jgi:hypothetical protein
MVSSSWGSVPTVLASTAGERGHVKTAVDLYLYPADAVVPLASLRLWPLDSSTYPR